MLPRSAESQTLLQRGSGCEIDAEPAACIGPRMRHSKATIRQQVCDAAGSEFVTVFGVNCLAGREVKIQPQSGYGDGLSARAFQVHLHAGVLGVPACDVAEGVQIKVCIEFAVDAHEGIAVKGRGHTGGVIIGAQQCGRVFAGAGSVICAEQDMVTGCETLAQTPQQARGVRRIEIADARADVEHEAASSRILQGLNSAEVFGVVRNSRFNSDAGKLRGDGGASFFECRRGDIERAIGDTLLALKSSLEQQAGFSCGTGAEFDESKAAITGRSGEDLRGVFAKDGTLSAGEIVLR